MTLAIRLEKLRFIVDELQIALHLASSAPDAATARMLSRHILVRAFDFIDHARRLRKPLQQIGVPVAAFNEMKETYAADFDSYFVGARHRLSAHVQDLDFEARLALWNDVEISKVDYFVDGAREIYVHVGTLGLADYRPFAPPPETTDADLAAELQALRDEFALDPRPELASDSLALTRSNTVSAINLSPVHQRAAQLALLRRWIRQQRALLVRLDDHVRVRRILRARLLTDVVSFADCLTTRPVPDGVPQAMDGLDDLIRQGGQSAAPIEAFQRVVNLDATLATPRTVRNKIGGHLDVEATVPLASVLAQLDGLDLDGCLSLYERLEAAFIKTCRGVIYLVHYTGDGQRMRGVLGVTGAGATPFDPARPDPMALIAPPEFNETEYRRHLQAWRTGGREEKADADSYFYQAFSAAPVDQVLQREERLGSGVRYHEIELRTSHQFVVNALSGAADDETVGEIVELLVRSARGWPTALTEALLAYVDCGRPRHRAAIAYGLGQLAPWWHEPARAHLTAEAASGDITLALWARAAVMRMYLREEVSNRANKRSSAGDWQALRCELLNGVEGTERILQLLIFHSQFSDTDLRTFADRFKPEIERSRIDLMAALEEASDPAVFQTREAVVRQLVDDVDMAGVALMLATELVPNDATGLVDALLWAVCYGPAVHAQWDGALRHLALCYVRVDAVDPAVEILAGLAGRNPDQVRYQLLHIELLARRPADRQMAREALSRLRSHYQLDAEATAHAEVIESGLAGQAA